MRFLELAPHSDYGGFPIFEEPLLLTEQGVVAYFDFVGLIRFQGPFSLFEMLRLRVKLVVRLDLASPESQWELDLPDSAVCFVLVVRSQLEVRWSQLAELRSAVGLLELVVQLGRVLSGVYFVLEALSLLGREMALRL